ncbi:hypothetical protein DMN91_006965 [Ooceraea biroi]|uniref:Uncharacterized protein n=1 Tax=Ooceraea biroi TaxID=2015173 RepID=A0A3L8DIW6_OOCBI|nr:hypothetical protein DMN91_006965 [Ooceraea biroi]
MLEKVCKLIGNAEIENSTFGGFESGNATLENAREREEQAETSATDRERPLHVETFRFAVSTLMGASLISRWDE